MKRILLILSLCFFALGIVACSGGSQDNNAYFIKEQLKLQVGDSYKVQYVGDDVDVKVLDNEIASLSVTDVVTALKVGETKLQLISGSKVLDELNLEVVESSYVPSDEQMSSTVYRISFDATEKRIFPNGSFVLTAKVYKNNSVCEEEVAWNFGGDENPIINAIANKNQLTVCGVSLGKTTITATIGEFTAVCTITVADINYQTLSTPTFASITENTISWNTVENADGYKVSVNNGISWQNVDFYKININTK